MSVSRISLVRPAMRAEVSEVSTGPAQSPRRRFRSAPALPIERMLPAEPIDRIEPAEPIERMLPLLPIDRIEPTEAMLSTLARLKRLSRLSALKRLRRLLNEVVARLRSI